MCPILRKLLRDEFFDFDVPLLDRKRPTPIAPGSQPHLHLVGQRFTVQVSSGSSAFILSDGIVERIASHTVRVYPVTILLLQKEGVGTFESTFLVLTLPFWRRGRSFWRIL